ncbi:unnamed protein product [Diamesa serratosioi]
MGFWQENGTSWTYRFYGWCMHLFLVEMFLLCQIMYVIMYESVEELSDCLSLLFTYVGFFFKSINLIYNINELKVLLQMLKELETLSEVDKTLDRTELCREVYRVRRYFKGLWYSNLMACFLSSCVPFYYGRLFKTPFLIWTPFDQKTNIYGFLITCFYQIFNVFCACSIVTSIDMLPLFCFNIGSGFLKELGVRFSKMTSKNNQLTDEDHLKELLNCIEIHQKIKEFAMKTQSIFSPVIWVQGFISVLIMCTTSFTLTGLKEATTIIKCISYLFAMTLQIFLPCYFGNEILISSQHLSMDLFHSDWINKSYKFKIAMKLFMENSKKPIKITAFGIFEVNLATFTSICNSAFSLYAVFKNVYY